MSSFLLNNLVEQKLDQNSDKFLSFMSVAKNWAKDIPVIGSFVDLALSSVTFFYLNPAFAKVFGALLGVPIGYILLRLFRGGG